MDVQAPFPEDLYPKELRAQPLPPPPVSVPFWKTRKGVVGITILAFAIIGAVVGIVVSTEKKSKKSDAKSDSASGAGGTVTALGGAGVAAVNWYNGQQIRLYIQKDDGFVYEATGDQSGNWNPNPTKLLQAKAGTPLAAVTRAPSLIHLYFLDISNVLQEYIYNSGWAKGITPLPSANIAPNTSLAATAWTDSSSDQIRLYYQKQDNTIQELAWSTSSASWSSGSSFTDQAYPGTSIGAVALWYLGNLNMSVYWQANDLTLNEYMYPGWTRNTLQRSAAPLSGIAAITWTDWFIHNFHVRVYHENAAGIIVQDVYDSPPLAGGWSNASTAINLNTLVDVPTPISTTAWANYSDIIIRGYVKNSSNNVHIEFAFSGSGDWTSKELSF
ncbi:hypothetical protein BDN72DRAFT_862886 [Pluteus cervinus]|uniref:Uncharacterized protein n=1 Tax=Pluteus cervinus TaxID=181527 RepID=A0ACD3AAE1_9AGAR|nr:hypothetical protein BDN72DRAFT_862886 [Pluteus cervinus]